MAIISWFAALPGRPSPQRLRADQPISTYFSGCLRTCDILSEKRNAFRRNRNRSADIWLWPRQHPPMLGPGISPIFCIDGFHQQSGYSCGTQRKSAFRPNRRDRRRHFRPIPAIRVGEKLPKPLPRADLNATRSIFSESNDIVDMPSVIIKPVKRRDEDYRSTTQHFSI
jgi:hypothetical protein